MDDLMDVDQSLDDLIALMRKAKRSTTRAKTNTRKTPHQTLPTANASARTMTKASFAAAAAAKRRGATSPPTRTAPAATSLFTSDLRRAGGTQRESSISTLDLRIESGRITTKELRQARLQQQAKAAQAALTKTKHTRETHFKHDEPPIAKLGAGDLRLTLGLSTRHLRRSPPVPTAGAAKSKARASRVAAPIVVATTRAAAATRPVSPPEMDMDDVPIQVTFTRPGNRTVGPAPPSPIVVELDRPSSSSNRRASRSPTRRRRPTTRSPDIDQSRRDRVQQRLLARGFKVVSSGRTTNEDDDEPMRNVAILPARSSRGRRDRSMSPVTSSSDRSMSIASTTRSPSPPPPQSASARRGARVQGEPEPGEILPHQAQYHQQQFGHAQQQHMYGFGVPQPQYISMPSYAPAYIQGPPVAQYMPAHAPPAPPAQPAPTASAAYRTNDTHNNAPVATYTCRLSNCHPKSSPSLLTNQFAAEFDGFLDVTARPQPDSRLPLVIYVTFSKRQSVRQLIRTLHNQTVSSYTMRAEPVITPPDIVQALQMKGINAVGGDVHAY